MDPTQLLPFSNKNEILRALQKSVLFGGEIWQSVSLHDRQILQISDISVDAALGKITITTFDNLELNHHFPIFLRLKYRSIIFKLDPFEFKVVGDKLICQFPIEIRAIEERKTDRYVLPFNAEVSMSIKRMERNIKEIVLDLEVRIVDVSESGFGIIVSGSNRNFLKKFDHFWIKAIDQKQLDYYVFGRVCYVAPKGKSKRGEVRIGLAMETPISPEMFSYLKSKCQIVLSA